MEIAMITNLKKNDRGNRLYALYLVIPAVVIYTNNYPSGMKMRDKIEIDSKYDAICMECQFIPNGINFDSNEDKAILEPDQEYHQMTRYSFKLKENKYYE